MQVRVCLLIVLMTGPATLTLVLKIWPLPASMATSAAGASSHPSVLGCGFHWCHYSARISASPGVQQKEKVHSFPAMPPETHTQLFSPAPTTAKDIATKTTMVSLSHGGTHHPLSCPVSICLGTIPLAQAVPQTPLSPHPRLYPECHRHPLWGQSVLSHVVKELLWLC